MDKLAAGAIAVIATACVVASAQKACEQVGTPNAEAVAYHAAAGVYRRMAVWCGQRALEAEASYWRVIHSG
jgi:hypothetical protein